MIAFASSKEEIFAKLKKDIYAKNDVWDFSNVSLHSCMRRSREAVLIFIDAKIQIYPIKCAFRKAS